MPSGKIHTASTLAITSGVLIAPLVMSFGEPISYGLGLLTGIFITPDLDLDNGNIVDSWLNKIFPPLQWAWRLFFAPYSWLMPHRSFWSHFPVVSTLVRLGYIFFWLNVILWIGNGLLSLFGFIDILPRFIFYWNWWYYFGLVHADTVHFLMDKTIKFREQYEEIE